MEEQQKQHGGGQNDFRKALEDVEEEEKRKFEEKKQGAKGAAREDTQVELGLLKTEPDKLYPVIYYALKKTLADWAAWMDARPGMYK